MKVLVLKVILILFFCVVTNTEMVYMH